MSLKTLLLESNYGKARYRVIFNDIQCRKGEFSNCRSGVDIDEIEKYGSAIGVAKAFCKENWVLTERKILVCGNVPHVETLCVSISVDKNLTFLVSQNKDRIKERYAVEVFIEGIEGLDVPKAFDGASWGIIFGPLK